MEMTRSWRGPLAILSALVALWFISVGHAQTGDDASGDDGANVAVEEPATGAPPTAQPTPLPAPQPTAPAVAQPTPLPTAQPTAVQNPAPLPTTAAPTPTVAPLPVAQPALPSGSQGTVATKAEPERVKTPTPEQPKPEQKVVEDTSFWGKMKSFFGSDTAQLIKRVVLALLLLIGGWFLAKLLAWMVYRLLLKTTIDNWLAEKLGLSLLFDNKEIEQETDAVERFVSKVVYFILMLLVIVGVLETLELETAAKPIENLVTKLTDALPDIGKAILILAVAYGAGLILQKLIGRALGGMDSRLSEMSAKPGDDETKAVPFSETTGKVVFWLVMILGIAGAVEALHIDALAGPMQSAIDQLVNLFPKLAIAALILIGGFFLSRIARQIVQNFTHSMGVDSLPEKVKFEKIFEKHPLSEVLGLIAMYLVLFQATVAALDRLEMRTLSEPLTEISARFFHLLPNLIGSGVLILIGIVIARVVRGIVEGMLKGAGFDDFMQRLGFQKLAGRSESLDEPSELVGFVVQAAITLLVAAQVLDNLHLDTWAAYVNTFLGFFLKNAIVAAIVIAIGFAVGNYVRDAILSGTPENDEGRRWLANLARYTILVFAMTMGIQQLRVAEDFVLLSFAILFCALCFALSLAFGLGSRDIAQDIVQSQYDRAKEQFEDARKNSGAGSLPDEE